MLRILEYLTGKQVHSKSKYGTSTSYAMRNLYATWPWWNEVKIAHVYLMADFKSAGNSIWRQEMGNSLQQDKVT